MIDISIMIEGQNGLNWSRWQRIARAVEDLGFTGLYRSDHFTNTSPPDLDSLELWVSLTWLASHTRQIRFGPLVAPASFRHPALTARMAAAVSDLSSGRLDLGLGAGWQEREHHVFGLELLDKVARFDRFAEYLEVVTRLLESAAPASFEGTYYQLREALMLPRPQHALPILIGGNGPRRTLPLVARYADVWNAVYIPVEKFTSLNAHLDALLAEVGRAPQAVSRSLMTGLVFAADDAGLQAQLAARNQMAAELCARGLVVGTPAAVADQVAALGEAGVQMVMLQWLDLDDLDGLEKLAVALLG